MAVKRLKNTLLFLWLASSLARAQPETGLFGNDDVLDLQLKMNLREVTQDIGEDREYHPATISYVDSDGEKIWIPVRVKTRGNTRRNPDLCKFPPLWLNFKKKETTGSIFEGQDKMKIVTHCMPKAIYLDNLFKEYLIYRQYNQITKASIRARLGKMRYIDGPNPEKTIETYVVLLEHVDQVAQRIGGKEIEKDLYHQDQCDNEALDLMVMFQYMIGHTDWSVSKQHNMKLIQSDTTGKFIPIPYDFDYSGVIGATYAAPDPSLDISSVKTRIFRGFCRPPGVYEKVIEQFVDAKEAMYALYLNQEYLDPKQTSSVIKYYDKFYVTLSDSKKVKNQINRACTLSHRHQFKLEADAR